jgi:AhpD family alkylhydroperoxidase
MGKKEALWLDYQRPMRISKKHIRKSGRIMIDWVPRFTIADRWTNRELIKLAMAIGARLEGAVHSHTRRALEAGATAEEIYHVVLLGLTTLGFPHTIAAMTWVEDDLKDDKRRERKGENQ